MSPAPERPSTTRPSKARPATPRQPRPRPVKPWQRAEAGRYRSSDERFTLESGGGGRWFVTDEQELDELGLARTTGPFATLDAAKAAADAARERPAAASPLASRIASTVAEPRRATATGQDVRGTAPTSSGAGTSVEPPSASAARSKGPPRTWLDELREHDAAAATTAAKMIAALERDGITGAEALVRRDLLGDRPAVATRLLARDVVRAVGALRDPTALAIAEAVAGVLAASPSRDGLPGWELVERDTRAGRGGRGRPIRLTGSDLTAAAEEPRGPTRRTPRPTR